MTLDESTSLDEVISLFVDINQQGVPVNRFDIVKAMYKNDPILRQAFGLLAVEQRRGQDVLYKMVNNEFTFVLKRLQIVINVTESNSKVDRMWEKLLELTIFTLTKEHRKPVEILKGFISRQHAGKYSLKASDKRLLRNVFRFMKELYKVQSISQSRLATDHTHFYILATALIDTNIFDGISRAILKGKISHIANAMTSGGKGLRGHPEATFKQYMKMSEKQTTDVGKRKERMSLFKDLISTI
jgi:hypothetical protein